ncbi:acyl-homoserine lactone acylase PvdQ [Kibdelosporangium banguiense]|uniref:Acyl-homoserine lactone acylase PvdQ n=1 Tax=Kibdelosporangium banguiense TaxID=1365924 RepID=A0ABS4T9D5_9PSEU|nr:penicillin acylase family protein [Kibdelosporangium banguiense]MBP2321033.1 acyl-homoserine lactone acylase PvdQ [Kibdelosporangium banguiense]
MRGRLLVAALSTLATATAGLVAAAPTGVAETQVAAASNDYCLGQCADILPPGANGNATLADILAHKLLGTRPAHASDQLAKYDTLASGAAGLTTDKIGQFFNDSSYGVAADQVESTVKPRSDVTIVRDKKLGIPHVTGTTRAGTMFGAGYAAAQDRLWLMDLFRRVGRGQLTPFAGGAPSNRQLEQDFFKTAPYNEAELQAQIERAAASSPRGAQALADARSYVDGVNLYIQQSYNGRYFPGEYVLTGHIDSITNAGKIDPFTLPDLVILASVVGAQFGGGGGGEVQSAITRMAFNERYGATEGEKAWQAFRAQNDPEAIQTLHNGQSFPYGKQPANPQGLAMPDKGSVTPQQLVYDPTGSAGTADPATVQVAAPAGQEAARGMFNDGVLPGNLLSEKHGMSNALVVSGQHTASGNPVAVFGPQTGYFAPQLLILQELQGPGISARGASFAGISFYVLLGRGQDYSWSATTSAQDIIDTYAVELCDPSGNAPTKASTHYMLRGVCTPIDTIERKNAWKPTVADGTAEGSYRLVSYRTAYGPITHRATVGGKPVAYTSLRSTYQHEIDSIIGFQEFNDPSVITSAQAFQQAASHVNYTFNWFYVDSKDTAYFNSGANPSRKASVDPNMPIWAQPAYEWNNWVPATNTASYTPFAEHPQAVNQDYFVSWNNGQAKDYAAAGYDKSAVHRVDLLDARVKAMISGGKKVTRVNLTQAMAEAALADLRAERVLPYLLRVIESQPVTDANQARIVTSLKTWISQGSLRKETAQSSHKYANADAIKTLDAWWPLLVKGQFQPGLGDAAYNALVGSIGINESPSGFQNGTPDFHSGQPHKGSSFQYGWWGYVQKDIRSILGDQVAGPLPQKYCGGGTVSGCRQVLLSTLTQAAAAPVNQVYPGDASCGAGDQWCADSIVHSPLGGITHDKITWQNRPTFQQVVEFPARRGLNIANLSQGKTATATSAETGAYPSPAGNAVDANLKTRWASDWSDNQSLTVDLGSVQPVSRAVLQWEAAYGRAYRIEVSPDATTWRPVYSTTTGDGGTDIAAFPTTDARYVRFTGEQRGTKWGYSLYEFELYAH